MSIWIIIESATEVYNGEHQTGEAILDKAFLTKEAADAWIMNQEYWWRYSARELSVGEN